MARLTWCRYMWSHSPVPASGRWPLPVRSQVRRLCFLAASTASWAETAEDFLNHQGPAPASAGEVHLSPASLRLCLTGKVSLSASRQAGNFCCLLSGDWRGGAPVCEGLLSAGPPRSKKQRPGLASRDREAAGSIWAPQRTVSGATRAFAHDPRQCFWCSWRRKYDGSITDLSIHNKTFRI